MFKDIDYRKTRAVQICLVFAATLFIQNLLAYPHAGWVGFAVMMIYAGFDKAASLLRTVHRFWGAILGLVLSYVLWFIGQIDYRLILMIIPVIVFMAFFTLGKLYAYPTIFTVTLTALGTDYYGGSEFAVATFFFEYVLSTAVAFLICLFFEQYVFKGEELLIKFFLELQESILIELNELLGIVTKRPLQRSHYLSISANFNAKVLELYAFVDATQYDKNAETNFLNELAFFNSAVHQAYQNICRLYVLSPLNLELLVLETRNIIEQLAKAHELQRRQYFGEYVDKKTGIFDF